MKLEDYIKKHYGGNYSAFGKDQEKPISRDQVSKMVKTGRHYVYDNSLMLEKRQLTIPPNRAV